MAIYKIEDPWIRTFAPGHGLDEQLKKGQKDPSKVKTGKWLIFLSREDFYSVWPIVKDQTELGLLGISAKITDPEVSLRSGLVCCIYTKDWKDYKDVSKVRNTLRELGFTKRLPYKTDEDTLRGNYGSGVSKYYE